MIFKNKADILLKTVYRLQWSVVKLVDIHTQPAFYAFTIVKEYILLASVLIWRRRDTGAAKGIYISKLIPKKTRRSGFFGRWVRRLTNPQRSRC
jgi:hypothetical protein